MPKYDYEEIARRLLGEQAQLEYALLDRPVDDENEEGARRVELIARFLRNEFGDGK